MSYQALYRVWRPQTFQDLIGQEHVTQTLTNALQEGQFSHAYLFSGPRGTGKTSAAKIFAKAVNCEHGPKAEPCNQCNACRSIQTGTTLDVVEIDAASNRGVDEIRDLRENVRFAPADVRYKVYIIDEVHMLTTEAFNALLKTLEEPPGHVIFILATTEPHKLLPTIVSRCQRFRFRRISLEKMVERLRMICHHEKVTFEEPALWSIARLADGGMRDALSLLDQSISFGAGHVSEEIVHTMVGSLSPLGLWEFLKRIFTKNTKDALEQVEQFIMDGLEPEKLIQDLILLCRDLLLAKTEAKRENEYSFLEKEKDFLQTLPVSQISWVMDEFLKTAQQLRWTTHPRILLEMLIVRLAQDSRSEDEWEHLQKKVAQLEQKWQKLEKNLSAPSGISHPSLPASPTAPKVQDPRAQEELSPKLARDFQGFHHDGIEEIRRAWPQVLQRVKEEKITVHAWLVDGEPVALRNQEILIAFRSKIHRNTTEKPKNKQLIERILAQVFQKPYQLKTIFQEQWEKIRFPSSPSPTDFTEKKGTSKRKADDIVKKAKELFGEEVVEVRDDRDLEGGRENA